MHDRQTVFEQRIDSRGIAAQLIDEYFSIGLSADRVLGMRMLEKGQGDFRFPVRVQQPHFRDRGFDARYPKILAGRYEAIDCLIVAFVSLRVRLQEKGFAGSKVTAQPGFFIELNANDLIDFLLRGDQRSLDGRGAVELSVDPERDGDRNSDYCSKKRTEH